MEIQCFLSLLVVFWPTGWVSADVSGDVSATVCGFEFHYLETSTDFYFLINQTPVEHLSFCRSLERCAAGGFLPYSRSDLVQWREFRKRFCSGKISHTDDVDNNYIKGRRLLHHLPPSSNVLSGGHNHLYFSHTKLVIASPIAFFLCCALICPCFRSRRKDIPNQIVQPKEILPSDSTSSFGASTKSDRVSGSPLRVPGSPLRAPNSPLRVPNSPLRVPHSPLRVPNSSLRAPNSSIRAPQSPSRFSMSPQLERARSLHLNIGQIVKATNNFSHSCMIREGSFGNVYKAQLPNGEVVAIKRERKRDYAALQNKFTREVDMLARIEHRNLVRLLDCIDKGNERIIITEYVSNGTLREHLDGQRGRILDFSQRLEIAIDVAHALTYLHIYAGQPIIHRDVKSSNILLTDSFRAKVTGFGFAKAGISDTDETRPSTEVRGTIGYVDPVYLSTSEVTPKSDVFSFGILLLEILSGRRPIEPQRGCDEKVTVKWALGKYTKGNLTEVLDPRLEERVDEEIVEKMLSLTFQCAALIRDDRPVMKEAAERLWNIRKSYRTLRSV